MDNAPQQASAPATKNLEQAPLEFKRLTQADAATLFAFRNTEFPHLGDIQPVAQEYQTRESIEAVLAVSSDRYIYGVYMDGKLIGVVAGVRKEGTQTPYEIAGYVTPAERGKKISNRALEYLKNETPLKYEQWYAQTTFGNSPALKMLRSMGFENVGFEGTEAFFIKAPDGTA
ncbi:MAG: GNAT family N-acetyltransferase [Patescibacteria group bacterium]